jgi:hypothetical protein
LILALTRSSTSTIFLVWGLILLQVHLRGSKPSFNAPKETKVPASVSATTVPQKTCVSPDVSVANACRSTTGGTVVLRNVVVVGIS